MLTDRKETSKETDSDSQNDSHWKQRLIDGCHRKEVYNIIQKAESGHDVRNRLVIHEVQHHQRNHGSHRSDDQTFYHERRPDESIFRAYVFHNGNLLAPYRNTHGDRIADQEYGYRQQDRNDRHGNVAH